MNGAARVRLSSGSTAADMPQECTDEDLGAVHPIAKLLCGEDEISASWNTTQSRPLQLSLTRRSRLFVTLGKGVISRQSGPTCFLEEQSHHPGSVSGRRSGRFRDRRRSRARSGNRTLARKRVIQTPRDWAKAKLSPRAPGRLSLESAPSVLPIAPAWATTNPARRQNCQSRRRLSRRPHRCTR